ncbi:MAG: sulfotransferase domain-containing protein [Rubrobacter sp.]
MLRRQVNRWDRDLRRLREEAEQHRRELAEARSKTTEMARTLGRARVRVEAAERERDRLKGEVEALRSQLAEVRRETPPVAADTPVFFVLGHGKSGTTWIQDLLDSHPEVLCRGEGRFFGRGFLEAVEHEDLQVDGLATVQPTSLYAALAASEHLKTWVERSVWSRGGDGEHHLMRLVGSAVGHFLGETLASSGERIVGDKTTIVDPGALYEVAAIYPGAKIIHVLRDGRDVAVSMIHHMWNYAKDVGGFYDLRPEDLAKRDAYREGRLSGNESMFSERRLRNIARVWRTEVEGTRRGPALFVDNWAEVRYEDLLKRPHEELARLFAFVGAADDSETVRRCVEANVFERWSEGRKPGQEESSSFYRKGEAGDWKNVFTERDKNIFKETAGKTLVDLGYERDENW